MIQRVLAAMVGVFLSLTLPFGSCAEDIPLKGQVVDADGKPVAGAEVCAPLYDKAGMTREKPAKVRTDEQGKFEFPNVRVGNMGKVVFVSKRGLATGMGLVEVVDKASATFVLLPAGRLAGRVLDRNGKPIPGAILKLQGSVAYRPVHFIWDDKLRFFTATTDASGAFVLDYLPMGARGSIDVRAAGYAGLSLVAFEVPKEGMEIRLQPEFQIKGTLKDDRTGQPVSGVELYASCRSEKSSGWGPTDANGAFTIKGLGAGDHYIGERRTTNVPGLLLPHPRVKVGLGEVVANISLKWGEGVLVEGRVLDADSKRPIPDAFAYLQSQTARWDSEEYSDTRSDESDSTGVFHIRTVPGEYVLNVYAPNCSSYQRPITVGPQAMKAGDMLLSAWPVFTVLATDEAGKPVAGARIMQRERTLAVCDEKGLAELHSDPGGGYDSSYGRYLLVSPDHTLGGFADITKGAGGAVKVVLRRCGVLTGVFKRPDGRPVQGLEVHVMSFMMRDGSDRGRVDAGSLGTTDASGSYVIKDIPPGNGYAFWVTGKGFYDEGDYTTRRKYAIPAGATVQADPMTIALGEETINGRVIDTRGTPIPGAQVRLLVWREVAVGGRPEAPASVIDPVHHTGTDESGRFKFGSVVKDTVKIEAWKQGYRNFSNKFKPEQFANLEVVLLANFSPKDVLETGVAAAELKGVEWVQGEWKGFEVLRGKRVAMAFVSIKNRACRKAIADLQAQAASSLQLVIVHDASATAEEIKAFCAEKKIAWPVARVTDEKNNGWFSPAFMAYKVTSVPTVIYVGADGKIQSGGSSGAQ